MRKPHEARPGWLAEVGHPCSKVIVFLFVFAFVCVLATPAIWLSATLPTHTGLLHGNSKLTQTELEGTTKIRWTHDPWPAKHLEHAAPGSHRTGSIRNEFNHLARRKIQFQRNVLRLASNAIKYTIKKIEQFQICNIFTFNTDFQHV